MSKASTAQGGPKKKLIMIMGAIGLGMLAIGQFTSSGTDAPTSKPSAPAMIDPPTGGVNQLSAVDKDAALTLMRKELEAMREQNNRNEQNRVKSEKARDEQLRELEGKSNAQARGLSEQIAALKQQGIDDMYAAINLKDKAPASLPTAPTIPSIPVPSGGLSFDGDLDLGPDTSPAPVAKSNPYGPNYHVLRPTGQAQSSFKGKSGGGQGTPEMALFEDMSSPSQGSDLNSQFNDVYGAPSSSAQPTGTAQPVAQSAMVSSQPAPQPQAPKKEVATYEVPAFSFVEVTLLHGVACPIGANSPGASDSNKIPARPVVIPIRGVFHGPNNSEKDLGTAHLMGLCSGRRTSSSTTGRATIRVEQLSYWDESGKAQMVSATGYIVDDRDNEQDVYGRLDKASGRTLALQSAAAAAAAFSTTMSASEFTNTSSVQNGTSSATSQLTGDATKAAVSQGIGAMFTKISQRFEAEADAAVDTVQVEPGIRLRFVTDQPIKVVKPLEPFDIDASMYDTLI